LREKIGFAKWVLNWVGGKQEWNESIEECMIREAKEDIWIDILNQEKIWILNFYFYEKTEWNQAVHLFEILEFSWEIIESEEIRPFWFDLDKIPYEKMWEDDIYWLPRILAWEKNIEYNFWFDTDNGKILKWEKVK